MDEGRLILLSFLTTYLLGIQTTIYIHLVYDSFVHKHFTGYLSRIQYGTLSSFNRTVPISCEQEQERLIATSFHTESYVLPI